MYLIAFDEAAGIVEVRRPNVVSRSRLFPSSSLLASYPAIFPLSSHHSELLSSLGSRMMVPQQERYSSEQSALR